MDRVDVMAASHEPPSPAPLHAPGLSRRSSHEPPSLPAPIIKLLRRRVRRRRLETSARVAAAAIVLIGSWLFGEGIIDRIMPLPAWLRVTTEIAVACSVAALALRTAARLRMPIPWLAAACEIEGMDGRYEGMLETIVSQQCGANYHRGSERMLAEIAERAARLAATPPAKSPAKPPAKSPSGSAGNRNRPRPTPTIIAATLAAAAIGAAILIGAERPGDARPLLRRLVLPLSGQPPVTGVHLHVMPGNISLVEGAPLVVIVHADGLGDALPIIQFYADDPRFSSAIMPADGDEYQFRFASIDRPMKYRIVAGNAVSPRYRVTVNVQKRQPIRWAGDDARDGSGGLSRHSGGGTQPSH